MTYSYDRRASHNSATPSFDAIVKANLEPKLKAFGDRAVKIADKVEDALKSSKPWAVRVAAMTKLLNDAAEVAYKVIDLLRPIANKGRGELAGIEKLGFSRDAVALLDELFALDGFRNSIFAFLGKQDPDLYDRQWKDLPHHLAMSVLHIGQFYRQLKENYGR